MRGLRVQRLLTARGVTWGARVVGVLTVLSIVAPARRRLQAEAWFGLPQTASVAGLVVTVVAGVALMLATGLRRRKRRAWQLAVVISVALVLMNGFGRQHGFWAGGVALLFLGALLLARREFTALPDPVGRLAALGVALQLVVGGFLIELLLLLVRPSLLQGRPTAGAPAVHPLWWHSGVDLVLAPAPR